MVELSNLPQLMYGKKPALAPQNEDLERLYDLIVDNFCLTVLEFGCGYSTLVIEQALKENERRWNELEIKPEVRNPNMFECHSTDNNEKWIDEVKKHSSTYFYFDECEIVPFNGILSHRYIKYPSINPDFIYIDGPDPLTIWPFNMPISSDLLYMEAYLIPGTIVLVDGRTNNVRFLKRNLQRNWSFEHDPEQDYTIMRLEEKRLGKINAVGRDILEFLK